MIHIYGSVRHAKIELQGTKEKLCFIPISVSVGISVYCFFFFIHFSFNEIEIFMFKARFYQVINIFCCMNA